MEMNDSFLCRVVVTMMIAMTLVTQMMLTVVTATASSPCSVQQYDVPAVIQVGVFVWADTDERILTRPISSYAPIPPTSAGFATSAPSLLQPFYLGVEFYMRQLADVGGGRIPVRGATESIALNVSYINLGRVDWNNIVDGFPFDGFMSLLAADAPGVGLFDQLVHNSAAILGENKTFTFFVPHPFMGDFVLPLLNRIEDARLAIMVHPLVPTAETFVCDGVVDVAASATPDCTAAPYNRKRLLGARRFETLFGTLPDLSYDAATTLDLMHTMGVKRVAMFRDARSPGSGTYGTHAMNRALAYAAELGLEVVLTGILEPFTAMQCNGTARSPADAPNCPPVALRASQTQVWPNGTTAVDWARRLRDVAADAVVVVATTGTPGAWSFAQLIVAMQSIAWTPAMFSFVGAFEKYDILPFLPNGVADMLYMTGEIVWDAQLRGADYQTETTSTNFEVIDANATHSAPARFTDLFNQLYGPDCNNHSMKCVEPAVPGTAHPFWNSQADGGTMSMIGFTAMVQIQKLIEAAATDNVDRILATASTIDTPGAFHRIAFDTKGRTRQFPVVVTQYGGRQQTLSSSAQIETVLLSPYNIGVDPVYPMPKWEDRVFAPSYYATPEEKVMAMFTAAFVLLTVAVLANVAWYWTHPLIRASTASFSILVALGAIAMLASNFVNLLHTNTRLCAAQAWLWTLGFTLMISSIVIKTFRIWRIFLAKRLKVSKMPDSHLFVAVAAFVAIDVILNSIWQIVDGMPVRLEVPDPLRPRLNYYQCDYSSTTATNIVWAHVVTKTLILVACSILAVLTRNVPGMFNDSLIHASYNLASICIFVVPLVGTGVGGRTATMLIRAFGVMILAFSTQMVLYAPKLYTIHLHGFVNHVTRLDNTNNNTNHTHVNGSAISSNHGTPGEKNFDNGGDSIATNDKLTMMKKSKSSKSVVNESPKQSPKLTIVTMTPTAATTAAARWLPHQHTPLTPSAGVVGGGGRGAAS